MTMTGRDHIAGQVGNRNRGIAIGKGNTQQETRNANTNTTTNYFDFGWPHLRELFEEDFEEGMGELSRIIREVTTEIALTKYRLEKLELMVSRGAWVVLVVLVLLALIFWKLYFGGVEVIP